MHAETGNVPVIGTISATKKTARVVAKSTLVVRSLVAAVAVVACSGSSSPPMTATSHPTRVDDASGAALLQSTEWLARHLDAPGLVILHVDQDRRAYDEGHIPGARFLSLGRIAVDRDIPAELPSIEQLDAAFEEVGVSDNSRVVLYGGMGGLAPARAFFSLDVLGRADRVALLDGGLEAWKDQGRGVASEPSVTSPGTLTPRPAKERVVDAAWVRDHLGDPSVVLIDARRPAEFRGEEGRPEDRRRGHIPGAKNLYWEDFFANRETRRLHDRETLRAMFERAGARGDRTIVTYCTTGMRASFAYFVARYLGYETRMYDGSFADWSRREDLPVER
jgi:thiosulfate/3-mercaptopyruvate sulfurtransferase